MKIKLSYHFAGEPLLRQTPGGQGVWKGHRFIANNPSVVDCDLWVVLENTLEKEETAFVRSGRTVLITLEPPKKRKYPPAFLAQFDVVLSCHTDLAHGSVKAGCLGLPWHIGLNKGERADRRSGFGRAISYDDFLALSYPEKSRALSVIASTASTLPGHARRQRFVELLKTRLKDKVDVFGRGVRPVSDKAEAIMPYRFHLVLENSRLPNYWTEKLADSYLGWAFPIYWGCPNISEYFSSDSLIEIDIDRSVEAIDCIEAVIEEELTQERLAGLAAARALVLDRYNTFDVISRICESVTPAAPQKRTIRSQRTFRPSKLHRLLGGAARRLNEHLG
jgi:hypothetical protein